MGNFKNSWLIRIHSLLSKHTINICLSSILYIRKITHMTKTKDTSETFTWVIIAALSEELNYVNKLCMGQQKIASRRHEYIWYTFGDIYIYISLKCLTKNLHCVWSWNHYISITISKFKLRSKTTEDTESPPHPQHLSAEDSWPHFAPCWSRSHLQVDFS